MSNTAVTRQKAQVGVASLSKPKGCEAVSAAVLDAARGLFASRPYKDVRMRDIAEAARVNLGLLHRHFGSKELILQAVIQAYATYYRSMALENASAPQALSAVFSDASQAPFLRTLAHLILADLPVHEFIAHDGALAVLFTGGISRPDAMKAGREKTGAEKVRENEDEGTNVLMTFALFMGWSLFENFLVEASGQRVSHEHLREKIFQLGKALLASTAEAVQVVAQPGTKEPGKARKNPF